MSDATDDGSDPEIETDWEIDPQASDGSSGISGALFVFLVVVALVAAVGAVGQFSGIGWFGYRQWMYGSGDVYLGNYTREKRLVSIDGREAVELGPEKYEIVELVGGTSTIRVTDADGETLSTTRVTAENSDALFKAAGKPCLVASDVTSFYGRGEGELEFVEFIEADQRFYAPGSHNVIWPGEDFPKQLQAGEGPGIWIEKVGCAHLEDPHVMRGYLRVRLRERMGEEKQRMQSPR